MPKRVLTGKIIKKAGDKTVIQAWLGIAFIGDMRM